MADEKIENVAHFYLSEKELCIGAQQRTLYTPTAQQRDRERNTWREWFQSIFTPGTTWRADLVDARKSYDGNIEKVGWFQVLIIIRFNRIEGLNSLGCQRHFIIQWEGIHRKLLFSWMEKRKKRIKERKKDWTTNQVGGDQLECLIRAQKWVAKYWH